MNQKIHPTTKTIETIFDFDYTLFTSDSRLIVNHANGTKDSLNAHEYVLYKQKPDDAIDYGDFESVVTNPRLVSPIVRKFLDSIKQNGAEHVMILSARQNPKPIIDCLNLFHLPLVNVVALGSTCPTGKASYIEKMIIEKNCVELHFFDDSPRNIREVQELRKKFPKVKIGTTLIKWREQNKRGDHQNKSTE